MHTTIITLISRELSISEKQVKNTLELLLAGSTIPFISRYRKEATGALDEVQVGNIKDGYDKFTEIEKRKETILKTIQEQDKLTSDLEQKIKECWDITELEDIYLPYKPKRKTRGEAAREKGLEPLAKIIMSQYENNIQNRANSFEIGDVKDVKEA